MNLNSSHNDVLFLKLQILVDVGLSCGRLNCVFGVLTISFWNKSSVATAAATLQPIRQTDRGDVFIRYCSMHTAVPKLTSTSTEQK
jgi:hypothetical protein